MAPNIPTYLMIVLALAAPLTLLARQVYKPARFETLGKTSELFCTNKAGFSELLPIFSPLNSQDILGTGSPPASQTRVTFVLQYNVALSPTKMEIPSTHLVSRKWCSPVAMKGIDSSKMRYSNRLSKKIDTGFLDSRESGRIDRFKILIYLPGCFTAPRKITYTIKKGDE